MTTCKVCGREAGHGETFVTSISKLTRVECTECLPCRRAYLRHVEEDRVNVERAPTLPLAPKKKRKAA